MFSNEQKLDPLISDAIVLLIDVIIIYIFRLSRFQLFYNFLVVKTPKDGNFIILNINLAYAHRFHKSKEKRTNKLDMF